MQEIFKTIPNYEGLYQVSDLGSVKSLIYSKERILNQNNDKDGYLLVSLYKDKKAKRFKVHQLVAMAFLNHEPCGLKLVINHINFNKADNRVGNLEIVTNRQNSNQKHLKSSSKYVGVYWNKANNKWKSSIRIGKNKKYLGYFINEYNAHLAYQKALKDIIN
ncbi:HNH homing endonuclease [Polaribacter phage P12002L]|uniref:HNH homing endonuclease n=1 Tax=Polaribacter phage P12002L TaxID=1647386 RepID=A0A0F7IJT3_9CAUD|nr:HNH homing endonuclease [Polaribacter phage P12002L]AKG94207.1 HNH homing endonuclease [Polaribacter phage P12002L]